MRFFICFRIIKCWFFSASDFGFFYLRWPRFSKSEIGKKSTKIYRIRQKSGKLIFGFFFAGFRNDVFKRTRITKKSCLNNENHSKKSRLITFEFWRQNQILQCHILDEIFFIYFLTFKANREAKVIFVQRIFVSFFVNLLDLHF